MCSVIMKRRYNASRRKKYADGFSLATSLGEQWRAQKNPPKIYIGGHRIHHGTAGLGLAILGRLGGIPFVSGLGDGLMADDREDRSRWLDFERREPAYRLQYMPGSGQPLDSYGI